MKRNFLYGVALLLAGLTSVHADDGTTERIVYGQVTEVQPVTETYLSSATPECPTLDTAPKPPAEAGLVDLLVWDLQATCEGQETLQVSGYRVKYRWDGRTYTQTLQKHPGKRVPLLLKIR